MMTSRQQTKHLQTVKDNKAGSSFSNPKPMSLPPANFVGPSNPIKIILPSGDSVGPSYPKKMCLQPGNPIDSNMLANILMQKNSQLPPQTIDAVVAKFIAQQQQQISVPTNAEIYENAEQDNVNEVGTESDGGSEIAETQEVNVVEEEADGGIENEEDGDQRIRLEDNAVPVRGKEHA